MTGGPFVARRSDPKVPKGRYSFAQLEALWVQEGGPGGMVATTAAAIALAESGGNPNAANGAYHGLWQVGPGGPMEPHANARAAVSKYKAAGNKFTPWTTYTGADTPGHKKTYLNFMPHSGLPFSAAPGGSAVYGAAADAGNTVHDSATFFTKLSSAIFSADWWLRVGLIILGVLSFAFGIYFLGREFVGGQVGTILKSAIKK